MSTSVTKGSCSFLKYVWNGKLTVVLMTGTRIHVKRSRDKKHGLIYSLGISKSKVGLKERLTLWRLKSFYFALRFLIHISQSQRVLALDIPTRECCLGK
jgi:hypothetical protein